MYTSLRDGGVDLFRSKKRKEQALSTSHAMRRMHSISLPPSNRGEGTAGRVESLVAKVEGCGWFAARLDFLLRLDGGCVWSRSKVD
jgi:hypothetical protein